MLQQGWGQRRGAKLQEHLWRSWRAPSGLTGTEGVSLCARGGNCLCSSSEMMCSGFICRAALPQLMEFWYTGLTGGEKWECM